MAKLRYIKDSFWSDEWIEGLSLEEKWFFLYLLTNQYVSLTGIYPLTIRKMAFEINSSMEFVQKTLEKFQQAKKVYYLGGNIIIVNFVKNQKLWWWENKLVKWIVRELEQIPSETLKLITQNKELIRGLEGAYKGVDILYYTILNLIENNISSLRSDILFSPSNLDDLSNEQTDFSLKNTETEKINEPITGPEQPRAAKNDQPERPTAAEPDAQSRYARELAAHEESFAIFWAKYPRKVSKQEAFKAWKNLTKKAQKAATDAIDAHRDYWLKTDREKDKIPHAATWLRGKRWEDEVNFTPVAVDAAREKFKETEQKNAETERQKQAEIAAEKQKLLQFFRNLPDEKKAELREKAHTQTAKIIKPETMGFDAMVKAKLHVLTRQLFERESQK